MTAKQYDKMVEKRDEIKKSLKNTMINPEEAIDALMDIGFGKTKSIQLVDEWGKGKFAPYSVWSKIKLEY